MAKSGYFIGPRIGVEGEAEFRKEMDRITESVKTYTSELQLLDAQYGADNKSVEKLTAQHTALADVLAEQTEKVEQLEKMVQKSTEKLGESDKATQKYTQILNAAKIDVIKTTQALEQNEKAITGLSEATGDHLADLKKLEDEYQKNKKAVREQQEEFKGLKSELDKAEKALDSARESTAKSNEEIERQAAEVEKLRDALGKQEAQLKDTSRETERLKAELKQTSGSLVDVAESAEDAGKDLKNMKEGLEDVSGASKEAKKEGENFGSSFLDILDKLGVNTGDLREKIESVAQELTETRKQGGDMGSGLKTAMENVALPATLALLAALENVTKELIEVGEEGEKNIFRLKESLGITEEEAREMSNEAKKIFSKGWGESLEEVEIALIEIRKMLHQTGDEATETAKQAFYIQDIFGKDLQDVIKATSQAVENFGISSDEALGIILAGLQNGADKSGDFLDSIDEFSPIFAQAGGSFNQFVSLLISGLDSGARSTNEISDAFKDFFIAAREGSDEFKDALSALGMNSKSTTKILVEGNEQSIKTYQEIVKRLGDVKNAQKQAEIASALFGTKWEDIGTKAIVSMGKIDSNLEKTTRDIKKATRDMEEATSTSFDRMSRTINTWFSTLGSNLVKMGNDFRKFWQNISSESKNISLLPNFKNSGKISGYASGTSSATPGLHVVSEGTGPEIITAHGKQTLVPSPSMVNFQGGEQVLNAAQTQAVMGNRGADVSIPGGQSTAKIESAAVMAHNDADRIVGLLMDIKNKLNMNTTATGDNVFNVNIDPTKMQEIDQLLTFAKQAQIMRRKRGL